MKMMNRFRLSGKEEDLGNEENEKNVKGGEGVQTDKQKRLCLARSWTGGQEI